MSYLPNVSVDSSLLSPNGLLETQELAIATFAGIADYAKSSKSLSDKDTQKAIHFYNSMEYLRHGSGFSYSQIFGQKTADFAGAMYVSSIARGGIGFACLNDLLGAKVIKRAKESCYKNRNADLSDFPEREFFDLSIFFEALAEFEDADLIASWLLAYSIQMECAACFSYPFLIESEKFNGLERSICTMLSPKDYLHEEIEFDKLCFSMCPNANKNTSDSAYLLQDCRVDCSFKCLPDSSYGRFLASSHEGRSLKRAFRRKSNDCVNASVVIPLYQAIKFYHSVNNGNKFKYVILSDELLDLFNRNQEV